MGERAALKDPKETLSLRTSAGVGALYCFPADPVPVIWAALPPRAAGDHQGQGRCRNPKRKSCSAGSQARIAHMGSQPRGWTNRADRPQDRHPHAGQQKGLEDNIYVVRSLVPG